MDAGKNEKISVHMLHYVTSESVFLCFCVSVWVWVVIPPYDGVGRSVACKLVQIEVLMLKSDARLSTESYEFIEVSTHHSE